MSLGFDGSCGPQGAHKAEHPGQEEEGFQPKVEAVAAFILEMLTSTNGSAGILLTVQRGGAAPPGPGAAGAPGAPSRAPLRPQEAQARAGTAGQGRAGPGQRVAGSHAGCRRDARPGAGPEPLPGRRRGRARLRGPRGSAGSRRAGRVSPAAAEPGAGSWPGPLPRGGDRSIGRPRRIIRSLKLTVSQMGTRYRERARRAGARERSPGAAGGPGRRHGRLRRAACPARGARSGAAPAPCPASAAARSPTPGAAGAEAGGERRVLLPAARSPLQRPPAARRT